MNSPRSDSPSGTAVVHGIRLRGAVGLLPRVSSTRRWTHELNVTFETSTDFEDPSAIPKDNLIAHQVWNGETEYAFSLEGSALKFCFPGFCEGVADLAARTLHIRAATMGDAGLLLPNTILASVLPVDALVLHASAVELDGEVFAICGPSGGGKSTIAAALTLAGASIVSDDALRLQVGPAPDPVFCFPGMPVLRLRNTRGWPLPLERLSEQADDRLGYLPQYVTNDERRVRALLFPTISPSAHEPVLAPLRGNRRLELLLGVSRLAWTPLCGAQLLRHLTQLSARLDLFELHLPENYFDDLASLHTLRGLLDALRSHHAT